MDFTYLFIIFLMIFAVQANQPIVALALLAMLLVMSKSKIMTAVALVGGLIALAVSLGFNDPLVIGGGLIVVVLLLVKGDPTGGMMGPQGYPGQY